MALNNNLIYFKDNILIWNFPSDVFAIFNEVYILTYMFDAQIQRYYYDVNNIKYQKCITEFKNGQHSFTDYNNDHEKKLKERIGIRLIFMKVT